MTGLIIGQTSRQMAASNHTSAPDECCMVWSSAAECREPSGARGNKENYVVNDGRRALRGLCDMRRRVRNTGRNRRQQRVEQLVLMLQHEKNPEHFTRLTVTAHSSSSGVFSPLFSTFPSHSFCPSSSSPSSRKVSGCAELTPGLHSLWVFS